MKQENAFNLLKMGVNVFLTGAAGSGKTYILNQYIHYLKSNNVGVAVTASTGIAATHLQGSTIHTWSGIGIKDNLTQEDLKKLSENARIKRNYKKTKVLIIDEISMLHKHQLDMVDSIARYILGKDEAFGGIQIVLCGDFFQLPPVSSGVSSKKYFAFEADAWQKGNFYVCYLEEHYRQGNDPLLTVLNDIRSGTAGEQTKVPLRTRYKKEPTGATQATKLYSKNINVDLINECELANLPGREKEFIMETSGFSKLVEGLKRSCLASEILKLKVGAEAMFIKNDPANRYVNGTQCMVVGFDEEEGWPVVKTYDNQTFIAYPEEWKYEENGLVHAILRQVPLRLAWAITIHKSQGMTLDAAEIDLGDAFEPGMGYVALSRVRSLSGLKLMNLNEMALKVNPDILEHDQVFKKSSADSIRYLQTFSEQKLIEHQGSVLLERFAGSTAKTTSKRKLKEKKPKPVPTHLLTLALVKENLSLDVIAKKRGFTIYTILSHLEKLKTLKLIDEASLNYIKAHIPLDAFQTIYDEFKQSTDGKLKPIYEKFEGKYSYDSIQLVRLFV